ncbi:MAG: LPS export ABC transporter periplasmic protein LptC [Rikenellaceae bacterium]
MQRFKTYNIFNTLKALLIIGGATAFMGCDLFKKGVEEVSAVVSKERLMTEKSENLTVVMSENGRPSYIFEAALVEGYTLAKEPYREFRKGIKITTFDSDDMSGTANVMSADYAIYYEERRLWEIIGNVEVVKSDGKELYSQQLFWNARMERIYSNVDTEIRDRKTGDIYRGEGFESDEDMQQWTFRRMTGRMKMAEHGGAKSAKPAAGSVVDSNGGSK